MSSLFGKSGGGSRFQLPALNLNFGSITDGTNIPPPPESPVQKVPTPPQTPPPAKDVKDESKKEPGQDTYSSVTEDVNKNTPQPSITASSNGNLAGTKRYADEDAPLSPAASSRQGSIRRLFSRTMLNNTYAEGQISSNGSVSAAGAGGLARPSSQGGASYLDERKSRRTSGWFRRMRTGETIPNKRASTMFMEEGPRAPTPKKQSGPPPPMIPELTDLEKDNGSLGSDLFKNIK
ncbi:hypothetical protein DER46DRAFT_241225 [Fusarium sp. MPI-SDFR-AT-0072]|uniref:Uncharacterized protein n=1 Tax=Fusarium oxysporum f. sp. rapae TaxID=485398 RepID=A0A8J5NWB4_FUSOX|nr:hypothetical protein Forpe1208_v008934 [Fusarium oxysporum f. sp. rapae]KAH7168863.1 hypothetical protein DER46DRAFT_241225 [Fusarium sp. MPI-SDFR-AT-0072]KAI7761157.1 hypothetical protein LZL87_001972 [Fusarium oxysporum]